MGEYHGTLGFGPPVQFPPLWIVGVGRSFLLEPHPSMFPNFIDLVMRRILKYLYVLVGWSCR